MCVCARVFVYLRVCARVWVSCIRQGGGRASGWQQRVAASQAAEARTPGRARAGRGPAVAGKTQAGRGGGGGGGKRLERQRREERSGTNGPEWREG